MQTALPRTDPDDREGSMAKPALAALLLHAAVLAGLTLWRPAPPLTPPGQQEITIDLSPAMEQAEAVTPAEVSQPAANAAEAVAEEAPEPVEAVEQPTPVETAALPPEMPAVPDVVEPPATEIAASTVEAAEEVRDAAPPSAAVALPPETSIIESTATIAPVVSASPEPVQETAAVAEPVPQKPEPKRAPPKPRPERPIAKPAPRKPVQEQKLAPRAVVRRQAWPAAHARLGAASASQEESRGSAAAADPNLMSRYAAQLAAALRARLRYPEAARAQGISGVATLRFTLHRSGRVVGSSLARSAGHPALDQAALATASPGSSLPPVPAELPPQQLTISVPLRFNLN